MNSEKNKQNGRWIACKKLSENAVFTFCIVDSVLKCFIIFVYFADIKAIVIFEKLAQEKPERFKPALAGSYNNVGLFYAQQGHFGKAEQYYLKALGIYGKLVEQNPIRFKPELTVSYFNYAVFSKDKSYYGKALSLAKAYPENPYCKQIIAALSE